MELAQVRLLVADFAACYRFYAEVLGLRPQSGASEGPYEKFSPHAGSAGIALQDRAMMAAILGELGDAASGHRSLVVLRVDDLDGYCEQIVGRGAVLVHGPAPMTERMRVAHLKDPEGNLVELQEWLLLRT
ncbi:VOC family protein [Streptomyces fuscichromogenes]|uniref:Extradiol dioxygenase n=1 Tax=Streptomyces fuscichromogenes TaxID=1324013 RepID=A0A917X820_9ACTN|nr:VOC family protein [Streptomyces fuscichromogenes]GGM93558.1 extradiol dioxygenase [Streptomyces fuscichromogenes]